MDWNVVAQYLPLFEKAAWLTLRLGLAGIALAIAIGLVCALVQYYKVPVLRRVVGFYIQLSRNTPLLVQLFFIYFANRLAEDLGVKVNYVSTEAANRIEYLQTGKVDVILANFTVTPERAEEVDFALPYMNVALGVVSPDSNVITSLDSWNADDQMIVISGTTAETYLTQNYPDIPLQKYDSYATAKSAMENGGLAWANDNTEVIAFASQNPGYTVGILSLGSQDTIAPAVSKGNETLLNAINDEIKALGKENFFHADYEATLVDTYGTDYEDSLVVEGGEASAQ